MYQSFLVSRMILGKFKNSCFDKITLFQEAAAVVAHLSRIKNMVRYPTLGALCITYTGQRVSNDANYESVSL